MTSHVRVLIAVDMDEDRALSQTEYVTTLPNASGSVEANVPGGRKWSPIGKAVFGTVTQSVIFETDRPVVVSRATHD